MRAAVLLAALSSFVMAAPQGEPSQASEIGLIFTYTNGTQSEMKWVEDSISQVPLNSGGIVDNVYVRPLSNIQFPGRYFSARCAFLDTLSRGLGVGLVNGPGIIILESKDVIEYVQCNTV
ncbi:hypothetical protein V8C35DRAFT_313542 [Trichoderma chlorosporum]